MILFLLCIYIFIFDFLNEEAETNETTISISSSPQNQLPPTIVFSEEKTKCSIRARPEFTFVYLENSTQKLKPKPLIGAKKKESKIVASIREMPRFSSSQAPYRQNLAQDDDNLKEIEAEPKIKRMKADQADEKDANEISELNSTSVLSKLNDNLEIQTQQSQNRPKETEAKLETQQSEDNKSDQVVSLNHLDDQNPSEGQFESKKENPNQSREFFDDQDSECAEKKICKIFLSLKT